MEYLKTNEFNLDVLERFKAVLDKENIPYRDMDWNVYFEADGVSYKYSFIENTIKTIT